ncbi:MAG: DUF3179 domain-containing protein [Methylococcales bacterium]
MKKIVDLIMVLLLGLWLTGTFAQNKNGFDLIGALIPLNEIYSGGPAKDGIPAIDNPRFVPVRKADHLRASDGVLGIVFQDIAKAYPINILNWHEIVNDRFKDVPVVITFCPLCGSGMAYSTKIDGVVYTFGVSGLVYNSDVLLYDRQTQSLWSQLMAQAISGDLKGLHLQSLPLSHTTWRDWKTKHPTTLVLSPRTGYARDYRASPYADYIKSPRVWFPVTQSSKRFHPKEKVLGIEINGRFKAYPFVELEKTTGAFIDMVNGQQLHIRYDNEHRSGSIFDQQGNQLPSTTAFWFAWYAFHPRTEVFSATIK